MQSVGLSISINLIQLLWPLTYFCLWVYLYCSWCLVPKSRARQILHFIFLYTVFFQRLAVGICLVSGSIFISNVLLDIESFHPLFMSGLEPVDWSFTSSQVISSIFILWWKTAWPGISVTVTGTHIWSPKGLFGFHFKSRWAYFLSVCKSPWQSWCLKIFPLFSDCF